MIGPMSAHALPNAPVRNTRQAQEKNPDSFTPSPLRAAFDAMPTPVTHSRVTLLSDNIEAWNARWKLLESAEHTVNAQYYTWDRDIFGKAQLGNVYYRARQGADVRVMVDAVGDTFGTRGFKSHRDGQDYLQELVALPNAEAKVYHPHYKKLASALLHPCGMQGIAANHDKILEVDGRAGTVGGRNTGHQYFLHPKDDPTAWRDADVLLESPEAAQELRDAVDVEWDRNCINHPIHRDLLGNWHRRDIELLGAYSLMDSWLKGPALSDEEKNKLRESLPDREKQAQQMVSEFCAKLPELGVDRSPSKRDRKALQQMAMDLAAYPELRGSANELIAAPLEADVKVIDKTSAAGSGLNEINASLLGLLKSAQKSILIQSPYYVMTDEVIDALHDAGERGVNIRIATNSPSNTDSYFTQAFFLNDWKQSLAAIPNLHLFAATGQRKHHAKMAVIDDQVAVVGTYNMDLVSAAVNGEVTTVTWSADFAHQVEAALDKDMADPTVAYQEYKIARDPSGQALDAEGKAVLDAQGNVVGQPETVFGPENHVDLALLHKTYDKRIRRWNWARRHLPQLRPVRRFEGDPSKGAKS